MHLQGVSNLYLGIRKVGEDARRQDMGGTGKRNGEGGTGFEPARLGKFDLCVRKIG